MSSVRRTIGALPVRVPASVSVCAGRRAAVYGESIVLDVPESFKLLGGAKIVYFIR
jgi:hypothetical protein